MTAAPDCQKVLSDCFDSLQKCRYFYHIYVTKVLALLAASLRRKWGPHKTRGFVRRGATRKRHIGICNANSVCRELCGDDAGHSISFEAGCRPLKLPRTNRNFSGCAIVFRRTGAAALCRRPFLLKGLFCEMMRGNFGAGAICLQICAGRILGRMLQCQKEMCKSEPAGAPLHRLACPGKRRCRRVPGHKTRH